MSFFTSKERATLSLAVSDLAGQFFFHDTTIVTYDEFTFLRWSPKSKILNQRQISALPAHRSACGGLEVAPSLGPAASAGRFILIARACRHVTRKI